MKHILYLAGPIFGCNDDCVLWRKAASYMLNDVFVLLNPMDRDYRGQEDSNAAAIVQGDLADLATCDVVLVNAERPSWGTAMEVHEANRTGKYVVAFCSGPVSPWLRYHCRAVLATLEEAVSYIRERAA